MNELFAVGLNHKSAPLEVRERFSVAPERLGAATRDLGNRFPSLNERVLLSTCNRTELYAVCPYGLTDPVESFASVAGFAGKAMEAGKLKRFLYLYRGEEALEHLFRVAGSLDSLVVGETEISAQVKRAYQAAYAAGATGKYLNRTFQKALAVAKSVRRRSGIGRCPASVGSVSVELARRIFGSDLSDKTMLVVGTGKIGETTLRHLSKQGTGRILVCNRSFDRARDLAARFEGHAVPFENLPGALRQADIVISSTAAPHYVVGGKETGESLVSRRGRPLFLIDLAVPRDIDPSAGNLKAVYLWNIDQLQKVADRNLALRRGEAAACDELILNAVRRFVDGTALRDLWSVQPACRHPSRPSAPRGGERSFLCPGQSLAAVSKL